MKYATNHKTSTRERSTAAVFSPYFIEDIAMTPSELAWTRQHDVMVVTPR